MGDTPIFFIFLIRLSDEHENKTKHAVANIINLIN